MKISETSSVKLSVVIPARNESENLGPTLTGLHAVLTEQAIHHELIVIDDGSTDDTAAVLQKLTSRIPTLRPIRNEGNNGFGRAVQLGLSTFQGDCVAVMMADASDDPNDLVRFFRVFESGRVDCVFGTRFHRQAKVRGYPVHKLLLNRIVNKMIQLLFNIRYNDVTNAFKLYGAQVIPGLQPLLSPHFNLTVELPLKAIVRGYSFEVIPNSWTGRAKGYSKLKIREMGSRYLFIIIYCFIEKWLSRGDYRRKAPALRRSPIEVRSEQRS